MVLIPAPCSHVIQQEMLSAELIPAVLQELYIPALAVLSIFRNAIQLETLPVVTIITPEVSSE